jgi:hypothetical protein
VFHACKIKEHGARYFFCFPSVSAASRVRRACEAASEDSKDLRPFFTWWKRNPCHQVFHRLQKTARRFQPRGRGITMNFGTLGSTGKLNGLANGKNGYHLGGGMTQPKRPRDGKAWVGMLIGAYKDTRPAIIDRLLDLYGIDCSRHFLDGAFRSSTKINIPARVEVVIMITTSIRTGGVPRIVHAAAALGIPHVGLNDRTSSWREPLSRAGFDTPPLWRGDAAMVREAANHDTDEDVTEAAMSAPVTAAPTPAEPTVIDVSIRPPNLTGKRQSVRYADLPFAAALKAAREGAGLSREELGELIKIDGKGGITNWEQGKNLPFYRQWVKLKELFPDLPVMKGLRGEARYMDEQADAAAAKISAAASVPPVTSGPAEIVVPPPAPYVPPMRRDFHDDFHHDAAPVPSPAVAPKPAAPVVASPAAPQQPSTSVGTLQDYAAAISELQAADAAMAEVQARREAALAKLDACHARIIGRGSK